MSALSVDIIKQPESDMNRCKWFSVLCHESVAIEQYRQAVFTQMVFDDFSTKEKFLTLLPLKFTTRGVDTSRAVKENFA